MQLTTVGKEIWRAARKARQLEEAGADDPTVQERLQKLVIGHYKGLPPRLPALGNRLPLHPIRFFPTLALHPGQE